MVKRLLPTFATLMLLTGAAGAVDLGEAALQSGSGQALDAFIRLDDIDGLTAGQIDIRVAAADDFARFSLDREPILDNLQLTVDLDATDGPVLRLRSTVAIDQPYLSLLLDTRWPSGRVLTEYTLRLQSAPFSAQAAPSRVQPGRSESVPLTSEAEAAGDLAAPASVALAAPQLATSDTNNTAPGGSARDDAALDNASTITVGAGDTLWVIAQRVRPDSSVTVQQTMLALQRLNPEAFIGNNINQVLRGAVLRVPELADIRQLDQAEAIAEVARQNQILALTPLQPVAATGGGNSSAAQGELRIVAVEDNEDQQPDASAAGSQAAERERRLNELEDRLAVRQEELDRLERSNEELNARLSMLQQQVTAAQEIIRLRDLELAQLQQSLAEQANERPTPPPPPVVTMAPEGSPMERIANTLMNNTWALLGTILALIVLVVLVLAARNRAARAKEQEMQQTAQDADELLFADVAKVGLGTDQAVGSDAAAAGLVAGSPDTEPSGSDDAPAGTDEQVQLADAEAIWEDEGGQPEPVDGPEDGAGGDSVVAAAAVFYDDNFDYEEAEQPDAAVLQGEHGPQDDAGDTADPVAETEPPATTEELIAALDSASAPREPLDPDAEFDLETSFELDEAVPTDSGEPREQGRDDELDSELDWPAEEADELEAAGIAMPPSVDDSAAAPADESSSAPVDAFDDLAFAELEAVLADGDDDEDDDDGFGFRLGSDEVATKLDLARAYIDMGDEPGAREILEEVLQEGTDEQRGEARKLLERI